jgi:hypothetical protein
MAWQSGGKSLLFSQRRTHSSLVCACGAVSAMAWQTGGKSLFVAQRRALSSLVYVHTALSLPWCGKQVVSLCTSRSATLTAVHAVLSLAWHGKQMVSLYSSRSAALTAHSYDKQDVSLCSSPSAALLAHSCMCMRCCASQTAGKSLLFAQRRTHTSLVYVRAALFLPWRGNQAVSVCSSRSTAFTAHSCMCMRRCLCHGMANRR